MGPRRSLVLLVTWLALTATSRAQELAPARGWDPERTWVFAAGCLTFEDGALSAFPARDRRDVELVTTFREAGVPADRVVFLKDAQCTRARLERDLRALLARTGEGDLVVFYYTGHGAQGDDGSAAFAPHDGDVEDPATMWAVADIVAAIAREGRHDRALLLADCCYSGALADEARRRADGRVSFAVLASCLRASVSTPRWTFTECLLEGLGGRALVDRDGDARVELDELAGHAEEVLAFQEAQLTCFATTGRFDRALALAPATIPPSGPGEGELLEVEWRGSWYPARVLAVDGETRRIRYASYGDSWDEWVGPERTRPWTPSPPRPAGERVEVEWSGRWHLATVLEHRLGLHLVHFDGFTAVWDEWVAPARMRAPGAEAPEVPEAPGGR